MDYDACMLKLYFKEKGFSKEEIDDLLNENPFDQNYNLWLKKRENNNKTLAITLAKLKLISRKNNITEITSHPDDTICKFLENTHTTSCLGDKTFFIPNYTILMRGKSGYQYNFIKKLIYLNKQFILCECTKDIEYYKMIKEYYLFLSEQLGHTNLIESNDNDKKIAILKSI